MLTFIAGLHNIPWDFVRDHAAGVLAASPIPYIKNATPKGRLFDQQDATGAVSSVFTGFYVDHEEPLACLASLEQTGQRWPVGKLLDGHEFLFMVEAKKY